MPDYLITPSSWPTRITLGLALIHFPVLLLRFGVLMGGNGPWLDIVILAGPLSALLATSWHLARRRTRVEALPTGLLIAGYLLVYFLIWIQAGRPHLHFR